MNILNTKAGAYAALVVVGAFVVYFLGRRVVADVGQAAAAVGEAVNPVSDQNIFYRGVNAVGEAITGAKDFSLGTAIYDWLNPPARTLPDKFPAGTPDAPMPRIELST